MNKLVLISTLLTTSPHLIFSFIHVNYWKHTLLLKRHFHHSSKGTVTFVTTVMGDTISIWLKIIPNINPMSIIFWKNIRTLFQRKELKIGGANHFLSVQKDDRFKSCFLGSKVWQEGAAVSVPLSPFSTLWTETESNQKGLTKYFWWGLQSPWACEVSTAVTTKLSSSKLFIWTGTLSQTWISYCETCCRFLFSSWEKRWW